jgi:CDP-glycerol glycerophosphotransferase (TagB/SpsB family)
MSALLDAADILVTEFSTVALEAAIVGIPVIIATMLGDRSAPEMFNGLSVQVDSTEALRDAACSFATSQRGHFARHTVDGDRLSALVGPLDGQSGLRVARLIHSLQSRDAMAPRIGPDSVATAIRR